MAESDADSDTDADSDSDSDAGADSDCDAAAESGAEVHASDSAVTWIGRPPIRDRAGVLGRVNSALSTTRSS